ncbi:MAG: hypothetical protein HPY54_00370 [Chthonomonadetes bacterium]|nr:hypothetical protein [Chthonomonadetes bacterium]
MMLRLGWRDTFAAVCFVLIYVLSPPSKQLYSRLGTWPVSEYFSIAFALAVGFTFRYFHTRWSPEWQSKVGMGLLVLAGLGAAGGDFVISAAIAWSASLVLLFRAVFRDDSEARWAAPIMFFGFWAVILCAILVHLGGMNALGSAFAVAWALFIIGLYMQAGNGGDKLQEPQGHPVLLAFHGLLFIAAL